MKTGISWLDVRLGLRMLVKYPGLTLVGGVGMAVAIAIGAVFAATAALVDTTLPLEEGERVVAIESWDAERNNQERRILHDFAAWREELKSVDELGAYATTRRNLIVPGGPADPVFVAEMTASGFRLARVPALLGRTLLEEDERPGAPPVVVIGFDVWRTRFASDPGVVGRAVRLGSTVHTVVGVMPEGFAFPVNHSFWAPFRAEPSDYGRREGPGIFVFGRLAPGATLDDARAELAAVGQRTAAAFPETHARLRPRVVPYTLQLFDDMQGWEVYITQFLVVLLLGVVCANVAILVYARTATRLGEIAVRSALGASRRRIVGQLFVEALVLASGAAAVGLVAAGLALEKMEVFTASAMAEIGGMPFWIDFRLSPGNVAYVVVLVVLAAVIVGVVPALQATGRRLQPGLSMLAGGAGMRLGRTWTALIVAQVAFAVAALPTAAFQAGDFLRHGLAEPGFAAEAFLTTTLTMDPETPPSAGADAYRRRFDARYAALQAELVRRLRAEPGVSDVTLAASLPGQEPTVRIEADGVAMPAESASGHAVRHGRVDPGFFDAFDVPVLAGRGLHSGDLGAGPAAVVVNRAFVREVLGGGNAVGRRVRYTAGYRAGGMERTPEGVEMGRWYEIVGVVDDLPPNVMEPGTPGAGLYHAMTPGQVHTVSLALRARGATEPLAGRLREVATALDPDLRLGPVLPLDEVLGRLRTALRLSGLTIGLIALSVLLLSAAGIYALMSFAVAQRTREIGIRSALGADPHVILRSIFSRALGQLAAGVGVGLAAGAALLMGGGFMEGGGAVLMLAGVSALMLVVGLLAAVGPARRGLRIQPTEALRADG